MQPPNAQMGIQYRIQNAIPVSIKHSQLDLVWLIYQGKTGSLGLWQDFVQQNFAALSL